MGPSQCIFPADSEQELATVPGDELHTAWKLFVQTTDEGYVRVQQLAWVEGIGWYVQKSMVLPREVVAALVPQMRKALCLIPSPRRSSPPQPAPFLRLVTDPDDGQLERAG